ncbi:hypothetical protein ACFOY4_43850 [Actinomadura syzygii]|uniref:Uncharacterized protein n=1 Tax=Actinomadura syzygii TaxID=1427538 RepID=A0A5D0TPY0_9ACTN|nr:hypothetical protein [Actinomadura syzygii]TYC07305.1 hypothetical protein FXF65_43315 [Actinomadura syzygii]
MAESTSVPDGCEDLYSSLGKLVVASADMESRLRYVVSELAGDDDAGWIVFEGQSVEWLVTNGLAVLGQLEEMRRWPGGNSTRIRSALLEAQNANRLRNLMVHGTWRDECILRDEGCVPRPATAPLEGRVYHVCRSRYRKGLEERQFAISDIDALAEKMWTLEQELRESKDAAKDAWLGRT